VRWVAGGLEKRPGAQVSNNSNVAFDSRMWYSGVE
jgi:hypothetical protein